MNFKLNLSFSNGAGIVAIEYENGRLVVLRSRPNKTDWADLAGLAAEFGPLSLESDFESLFEVLYESEDMYANTRS